MHSISKVARCDDIVTFRAWTRIKIKTRNKSTSSTRGQEGQGQLQQAQQGEEEDKPSGDYPKMEGRPPATTPGAASDIATARVAQKRDAEKGWS